MVGSAPSSLFDHLPAGIYRITASGRVVVANRTLVEMLGYESFDDLAARAHRDGVWYRADGSVAKVRENVRSVHDAGGTVEFYEGIVEAGEASAFRCRDASGNAGGPAVRPLATLLARAAKTLLSADGAKRFLCRVLSAALHATGAPYGEESLRRSGEAIRERSCVSGKRLAVAGGLEPPTAGLTIQCSVSEQAGANARSSSYE